MTPNDYSGLQPSGCLPSPLDELLNVLVAVIWPSQAALSGLASLCLFTTTVERDDPLKLLLRRMTLGPLYAVIFLVTLPVALCAILFRCLLCLLRTPFQYSVFKQAPACGEEGPLMKSLSGRQLREHQFGIASCNTCLLPEFLARINNLSHSAQRARGVGERIVIDQFFHGGASESASNQPANGTGENDAQKSEEGREGLVGELTTHFPHLDFLCFQEVFDWNYNKLLRQELHKVGTG